MSGVFPCISQSKVKVCELISAQKPVESKVKLVNYFRSNCATTGDLTVVELEVSKSCFR